MGRSCRCSFQSNMSAPQSHVCKTLNPLPPSAQRAALGAGLGDIQTEKPLSLAQGEQTRSQSPSFPHTPMTRIFLLQVLLVKEADRW